jgi:flagellar hook-associated protein 1 FlgK
MSLFGDVSLLNSALTAFQYGLNTTSNNIANANTVGYSREVLGLQALPPTFDGSLALGSGVNATSISRVRDTFLDSQIKSQLSELGRATASEQALTELAAIFPEVASSGATSGLKGAIDNVVNAWTALAATPNTANQTAVAGALQSLATMLTQDSRQTFDLQVNVNDQVLSTISDVNTLTDQIASLNKQIKSLGIGNGLTGVSNTLLDLREQAAEKLAKLIGADFRVVADGTMTVSTGVGDLVNEDTAYHLIGINSPTDPANTAIGYTAIQGAAARNITSAIQSGTLGGLLSVRDGAIKSARLDLDRMAFGIITRSNEINDTYTAVDGTTQHDLFLGDRASNIMLNPIVAANPKYVGATRDASVVGAVPGDLALMQAQLKSFIQFSTMRTEPLFTPGAPTIDETTALGPQGKAWLMTSSGSFQISTIGGSTPPVVWNDTESLNDIIKTINTQGGGQYYATFNATTQELIIMGNTPMTVYDISGNFLQTFGIASVVTSSAPINNYPVPGSNPVDPFGPMNNTQNTLDLFSNPVSTGGTVLIDGNPVNWQATDDIGTTINLAISGATAPPNQVLLSFSAANQTVSLIRMGNPFGPNSGVQDNSIGNSMKSVQVVDKKGNLTRTLNLDTDTNSSNILDELVGSLSAKKDSEATMVQQAQAMVDQTQALQDAESKVDLGVEEANAQVYQRSLEASLRMQFILDDILNTLINHTGSLATQSSTF